MKTDKEIFETEVNKAYEIIWALYRPRNNGAEGCDLSLDYEEKLLDILNFIDKVMGR